MSEMPDVELSTEELDRIWTTVNDLVKKGEDKIRDAISREKSVASKVGRTDLVTETDKAVEDMLFNGLRATFPNHEFIGEESISAASGVVPTFSKMPTWIIDPIDGTMNFVHSNPNVCISVALCVNRRVEMGIVAVPMMNEYYTARRGQGAFLNGKPIKTSGCTAFADALVCTENLGYEPPELHKITAANQFKILEHAHGMRILGSAAIDMVYVASGKADVYLHAGIRCWDIAAGALIVRESGGAVIDPDGGEFDFMSRRVLAAATDKVARETIALDFKQMEFPRDFPDVCPL